MVRKGPSAPRKKVVETKKRRPRDLWTSAEVAAFFRAGVSSIKRWTDAGELESVRTPGSHRRYRLEELYRFAAARGIDTDLMPRLPPASRERDVVASESTLFRSLVRGDAAEIRRLVDPHARSVADRAQFLDRVVGGALRRIGEEWARGTLSIETEHRASYLLSEAIDALRPPPAANGSLAVLACPPGEWHELPLRLVRLVLEWRGWRTEFVGASLPWSESLLAARRSHANLLAFSARSGESFDADEFAELSRRCRITGTEVIIGGSWARGGGGAEAPCPRFRTLRGFQRWLASDSSS